MSRSRRGSSKFVGLTAITLAIVVAAALVPADPSPQGALFWPAVVLTLGLLSAPLYDALRNGWYQVLRAEHLLLAGLVLWLLLDLLQSLYPVPVTVEAARAAFLAIGLFALGTVLGSTLGALGLPRVITRLASLDPPAAFVFRGLVVCFVLGITYFIYKSGFSLTVLLHGLTRNRWAAPWSRGALGGWDAIVEQFSYFAYLLPMLTVVLALSVRRWWHRWVVTGLVLSAFVLLFLVQGGGRRILAVVVGAAVLTWLGAVAGRIRLRQVAVIGLVLLALAVSANVLLRFRNTGYADARVTAGSLRAVHVDDNFLRLAQVIQIIPEQRGYLGTEPLVYVAVRPIPRAIWPGKPTGLSWTLADQLGYRNVSLSLSVVGEWYMMFGWIGVCLGGLFYGALAGAWSRLLSVRMRPWTAGVYAVGALTLVAGIRALIELLLMTFPLLALVLVTAALRTPARPEHVPARTGRRGSDRSLEAHQARRGWMTSREGAPDTRRLFPVVPERRIPADSGRPPSAG